MADEEKKAAKTGEAEVTPEVKKSSLFTPKNIGIMIGLLIVLGTLVFFGLKTMIKDNKPEEKKESDKPQIGMIFEFSPALIVNIAGTQGTRYLKVIVSVEYDEVKLQDELTSRKPQFLDILNSIFSSKQINQISNTENREDLKREIRDKFNSVLINGQIKNIFFSDFVIQ